MASDTFPSPTFDEWVDLLNLEGVLDRLIAGQSYPSQARAVIDDRRRTYPDLPLDYIQVLNAYIDAIQRVEAAILEQNEALESFNQAMEEVGLSFLWDPARLMTEDERNELQRQQRRLERFIEYLQEEIDDEAGADEEFSAMEDEFEEMANEAEEDMELPEEG